MVKWLHPPADTSCSMNFRLEDAYSLWEYEDCLVKKVAHSSFQTWKKYCLETVLLPISRALISVPCVLVTVHIKKTRGIWMGVICNFHWNCYIQQLPLPTVINCCFTLVIIWTFVHLSWLSPWEGTPELGFLINSNSRLKIFRFLNSGNAKRLSNESSKRK